MDVITPFAKFFEDRVPSPVWRYFVYQYETYRRLRLRLRNAKSDDADLRNRFCPVPFENFELAESGSVYLCCSPWVPKSAGNLHAQDAGAIWNSQRAQDVRRSILDGSYRHCNHELCSAIVAKNLPTLDKARKNPEYRDIIDNKKVVMERPPKYINLLNDRSCNLTCPSCRTRRLNFTKGRGYELRKKLQDRLTQAFFSKPTGHPFIVNVTGSGDPFASRVFREFLYGLDRKDFPNLTVQLQTNGTLFNEKTWKKLNKIHGNIGTVIVSFDAACEQTYRITRRDGNWSHLVRNTEFLAELRQRGLIKSLRLDFVVQQANFREMADFVAFGKRLDVSLISFAKAHNWGTWSPEEFKSVCVWEPDHPQYPEFQRIISQPAFDAPKVYLGNMTQDRIRAMQQRPALALAH